MHSENQKMCTYFLKGKCRFGNKCHFSHTVVRAFLLRHTQSVFNKACDSFEDITSQQAKNSFQLDKSLIDCGLSEKGIKQIGQIRFTQQLYGPQQNIHFDFIFVSPLERTLMTADQTLKSYNITFNKVIVLPLLTEVLSKICDMSKNIEEKVKRYPYFDFSLMGKYFGKKEHKWQDQLVDDEFKDKITHGKKYSDRYMDILEDIFPKPLENGKRCFDRAIKALEIIKQMVIPYQTKKILIISHNRILRYCMGKEVGGKTDSFKNGQLKELYF